MGSIPDAGTMKMNFVKYDDCIAMHLRCTCEHPEFSWTNRLISAFLFEGKGGYDIIEHGRRRQIFVHDKTTKSERCVCGKAVSFTWHPDGVEYFWEQSWH